MKIGHIILSIIAVFIIVSITTFYIDKTIMKQPTAKSLSVILNKHLNDIPTDSIKSEQYETNILILSTNQIHTEYGKDFYLQYNVGDTLLVSCKRWLFFNKIINIKPYKEERSKVYVKRLYR